MYHDMITGSKQPNIQERFETTCCTAYCHPPVLLLGLFSPIKHYIIYLAFQPNSTLLVSSNLAIVTLVTPPHSGTWGLFLNRKRPQLPLRFDFNNAHARWLRGLSLQHHFAKPLEAEQESRRAVECARMQGAMVCSDLGVIELIFRLGCSVGLHENDEKFSTQTSTNFNFMIEIHRSSKIVT